MTEQCNTETCDNPATHTDQFGDPICAECVKSAIECGENPEDFREMFPVEPQLPPLDPCAADLAPATAHDLVDAGPLTIFEETLTESGLATITNQAAELPAIAKTDTDYNLVYEFSTRMKRLSVAVRKKEKSLQKDLRSDFNTGRGKINKDLEFVLGVIDPIITATITAREYIEDEREAYKEKKARDAQAIQQAEFKRLEAERVRIATEAETERQRIADEAESERQRLAAEQQAELDAAKVEAESERLRLDAAAAALLAEHEKLLRERYEFKCEKSRLSVDDAWAAWRPQADNVPADDNFMDLPEPATASGPPWDNPNADPISDLAEFAKNEPAEPAEFETFADATGGVATVPADIIMNDPAQKENQAIADDRPSILRVNTRMKEIIGSLEWCQQVGFESQTASDSLYQLIESVTAAADKFAAKF